MNKKHWIFAAAACAVCLGLGFGAGMLLAPRLSLGQVPLPINPMATADTPVSGTDAPAESKELGVGAPAPGVSTPALGAGAPVLGAQGGSGGALAVYIDSLGDNPSQDQQQFLYLAISRMENELRQHADRLQEVTNVEKELRVLITEVKELAPGGEEKAEFTQETFDECAAIQKNIVTMLQSEHCEITISLDAKAGDTLGSAEWQGVIAELESWKKSVHDYGDLVKYDLQSAYQDYSQQVQVLAGNQKQLYDDAMKILNQYKPQN